jgi:transcriptional regulator of heat shock response
MPKTIIDPETQLTQRQKTILFSIVKEYCDHGEIMSSSILKEKYGFPFSAATIRNEMVVLRDLGYLYQPFTNSSSRPTEHSFKMFINQLIVGLQVTNKQHNDLKRQISEMEKKHTNLSKEISRLLALTSGGVGFMVNQSSESISGMGNLLTDSTGETQKVSDILDFLDNLDKHKQLLLTDGDLEHSETILSTSLKPSERKRLKTMIGDDNPVLKLGKGYGMVSTEVYLENGEKTVVGLITPLHLLARKKNLELIDAISKLFHENGVN